MTNEEQLPQFTLRLIAPEGDAEELDDLTQPEPIDRAQAFAPPQAAPSW